MATDVRNGAEPGRALLALSTGSLYNLALDRVFELAAATDYDGVEVLIDARLDSSDVPYLRRLSARWGVPILSVHSPLAPKVEGWPETAEGRAQQAVRLAEALGVQMVVVHAPLRRQLLHLQVSSGQGQWQRLLVMPWADRAGARYSRWLCEELPLWQAESGVRVAVENMPAHRVCGRRVGLHHFADLAELRRFPYLVLDTTHWGTWGVDPVGVYQALRERIVHVHLSNHDGREHRLPFKGDLPLEALLREMRQAGFDGIVTVETDPWAVAEGDWSEVHLRRVLADTAGRCRELLGLGPSHSHAPAEAASLQGGADRGA